MKEVFPSYYNSFRCIAGACRHSCCIGWEIDIDEDTMTLYNNPAVPLYECFCTQIDRTGTPHFCLDKEERCPFLNQQGLCDIILTMGEESLCQICDDHPRFRNYFSDRTETGLGLCCEAAAELILFQNDPVTWIIEETAETAGELTEEESEFLSLREEIYRILQNRTHSLQDRLCAVMEFCDVVLPDKTVGQWCEIFRELERMDSAWDTMLGYLRENNTPLTYDIPPKWQIPLENLAVYFVFRHMAGALDDGRYAARIAFCVLSVLLIHVLWQVQGPPSDEAMVETVRLYSSEIEYSEENTEVLLSLLQS